MTKIVEGFIHPTEQKEVEAFSNGSNFIVTPYPLTDIESRDCRIFFRQPANFITFKFEYLYNEGI